VSDVVPDEEKYYVFKADQFLQYVGAWNEDMPGLPGVARRLADIRLRDAVVIRRQDKFASPALLTYAACIAITASEVQDEVTRARLLDIADYFQKQGELAGEEAFKLPD
jgi:hypothetical protein